MSYANFFALVHWLLASISYRSYGRPRCHLNYALRRGPEEGWDPIGEEDTPFTADFNGNRRTVSNLFIDRDTEDEEPAYYMLGLPESNGYPSLQQSGRYPFYAMSRSRGRTHVQARRRVRPAVFICDEYQAFASVGEDDPSGDEKSFTLTRQCRCIPIVATQSISSLRAVLGSSEAWRSLLQTLRTRIFLSLSDDASAKIASELCGQVAKIKGSYTISESSKRAEVSPLSGRAGGGGGSIGALT